MNNRDKKIFYLSMMAGFLALIIVASLFLSSCSSSKADCFQCEKLFMIMDDRFLDGETKLREVKKHLIEFHYDCWKIYESKKY